MSDFPTHVLVPHLDAEYADLGLGPVAYEVVGQSLSAGGGKFVQVFTGAGYLWLAPSQYNLVPCPAPACVFEKGHQGPHDVILNRYAQPDTLCAECAADGQEVRGETSHCHCGLAVHS